MPAAELADQGVNFLDELAPIVRAEGRAVVLRRRRPETAIWSMAKRPIQATCCDSPIWRKRFAHWQRVGLSLFTKGKLLRKIVAVAQARWIAADHGGLSRVPSTLHRTAGSGLPRASRDQLPSAIYGWRHRPGRAQRSWKTATGRRTRCVMQPTSIRSVACCCKSIRASIGGLPTITNRRRPPANCSRRTSLADCERGRLAVKPHGRSARGATSLEATIDDDRDASTSHLVVADSQGNLVCMTQSLSCHFGASVVVPGTGVLLNNSMNNFNVVNRKSVNALAPGKRPHRHRPGNCRTGRSRGIGTAEFLADNGFPRRRFNCCWMSSPPKSLCPMRWSAGGSIFADPFRLVNRTTSSTGRRRSPQTSQATRIPRLDLRGSSSRWHILWRR